MIRLDRIREAVRALLSDDDAAKLSELDDERSEAMAAFWFRVVGHRRLLGLAAAVNDWKTYRSTVFAARDARSVAVDQVHADARARLRTARSGVQPALSDGYTDGYVIEDAWWVADLVLSCDPVHNIRLDR